MTLDPTIEARVRAKRAAPLEQDADALALLDEVERLRDQLAHVMLCNAVMVEPMNKLRAEVGMPAEGEGAVIDEVLRTLRKAEAERDVALAACAEMRARGTRILMQLDEEDATGFGELTDDTIADFRAALARPDLGAGVVVVPRGVVEDVRTRIADLPGWNGSEGCLPSAFMMRDEHERALSAIADAMHGQTLQPLADRVRGYVEECAHLNEIIGALTMWAHEYGAALKPPGADTYGEGKRDAKNEVAAILRGREP